jgi:hypothetical protein
VVDVPTTGDVDSLGCDLANVIGFSFDEGNSIVSKILSFVGIDRPVTSEALASEASVLVHCLRALREVASINQRQANLP